MIDNPVIKVIDQLTLLAQRDGTVYCRITWDADKGAFNFTPLLKEHVEVHYGEKKHD